jgi:hypothetical protein
VRTVKVSRHDLLFALDNRAPGVTHYLDTDTGEVVPVFPYNRNQILAAMKEKPGRYVRLAPQSGSQGYNAMEEFTRTVSRAELREKLTATLQQKNRFRAFREVVEQEPTETARWRQFRSQVMVQHLQERLKAADIELALVSDKP